jgi:hypothetical protein
MRFTYAALAVMLITGCANTSNTAVIPQNDPAREAQPAISTSDKTVASAAEKTPTDASYADTFKVLEVKHTELDTHETRSANLDTLGHSGFDPYQCLMAWARGAQQNINPWLKTCDTPVQTY